MLEAFKQEDGGAPAWDHHLIEGVIIQSQNRLFAQDTIDRVFHQSDSSDGRSLASR